METNNNKFQKYSDEELRLMLAIAMQDDSKKAQDSFIAWFDCNCLFIQNVVYCAVLLEELLKELAAISMEHTLL